MQMTDFLLARKNSRELCTPWQLDTTNCHYDFYYDGLVNSKSLHGATAYLVGSPFLDYKKNETIESFLDSAVSSYLSGNSDEIGVYGFATLIIISADDVLLISDMEGYRPVYYIDQMEGQMFASRIHTLKTCHTKTLSFGSEDLDFSLIFGYFPGSSTVLEGVSKTSAGTQYLLGEHSHSVRACDAPTAKKETSSSFDDALERLVDNIQDSISSLRAIDDKIAVLLGGFDSALVAAIACKLGFEVETFSFYYEDSKYNQGKIESLSEQYTFKHHWIKIDENTIRHGLQDYARAYSTPSNWPNYIIQSTFLAKKIREKGFKVVLTGDGCDGLFQGYPQLFRSAKAYNDSKFISRAAQLFKTFCDAPWAEKKLGHVYRLGMRIYRNSLMKNPEKTFLMYRICDEQTLSRITKRNSERIEASILERIEEIAPTIRALNYTRLAYLGRSNMGPNRAKINGIVDNADLYIFSPYMHWRLKGFVNTLPEQYLRPSGQASLTDIGKYILVKAAEEKAYLSNDIIYQPKMAAVDAPIDDWYEKPLNTYVENQISASEWIKDKNFVMCMAEPKLAEKLYRKYISADAITSHALSLLLTTVAYENKN